jgi:uncharacterized protein (TIGR04551 family)
MPRPTPLLLALALAPLPGAAQQKPETPQGTPAPEVQAAIKKEVEKAKEELRDEIRARVQDRQAKDDFFEGAPPTAERQKLDLLQLEGAFRLRGDLLDSLALKRAPDPSGYTLFPRPIGSPSRGSLTSANLRLRLDPRLNVSEAVRVLAQVDLLAGQLLGQTPAADGGPAGLFANAASPADPMRVNRAWAEVQTPVGLLSFGRMPSQFGLGIFANAGTDLDADFGDAVDRVQLAIPVRQTLLGPVVLVPHYDLVRTGLVSQVPVPGGQPFDLDKTDDAWAVGVKLMRLDTDDELQRKLDKGGSSLNWGAWYTYRAVGYDIALATGTPGDPGAGTTATNLRRAANAHTLDLWGRWRTKRFRLELEAVGIVGTIQDGLDPAETSAQRQVLIREFGAAVQADWRLSDGKLLLGLEAGWASGDTNPGFGNQPGRGIPLPGDVEGRQFAVGDKVMDLRNFRFNPAYRVDLVLWREILGNVTDALYLKPTLRDDIFDGLSLRLGLVYSQAFFAASTPSTNHRPLGVELDAGLHYASDDGFHAWVDWGALQPLDGLGYGPNRPLGAQDVSRGHAVRTGLAVKF